MVTELGIHLLPLVGEGSDHDLAVGATDGSDGSSATDTDDSPGDSGVLSLGFLLAQGLDDLGGILGILADWIRMLPLSMAWM